MDWPEQWAYQCKVGLQQEVVDMAMNIPLPGSGMDAFAGGVNNMLRDLMKRQQMAQQQGQFDQDLGFRKQQLSQQGALLPYQQREAQLKIDALERANDPQKAIEYQNKWQQALDNYAQSQGLTGGAQGYQGVQPGMSSGAQSPMQPNQPGAPTGGQMGVTQQNMASQPMINAGGRQIPLSVAQMYAQFNAPIPGLKEGLANYYAQQKKYGEKTAEAQVSRQGDLGDKFSASQDGVQAIGRIEQLMDNYAEEAKAFGQTPHYGVGAEQRTEPDAWERFKGRAKQRISHPLESLTASVTEPEIFGEGRSAELHERNLSQIRSELNELVNVRAKALNSKFTEKEYDTLQRNKASIGDSEAQLRAKLKASKDAFKNGALKLQMQQGAVQQGAIPGQESFAVESQYPSETVGRTVSGKYSPPGSQGFSQGNYEYVVRDGKTYRKKIRG